MNSKELVKALALRLDIPQYQAEQHLNDMVKAMRKTFQNKESVQFQNFGTLSTHKLESRKGYSPILEEYVIFPPRRVLEFHPSDNLKEKVKNIQPQ